MVGLVGRGGGSVGGTSGHVSVHPFCPAAHDIGRANGVAGKMAGDGIGDHGDGHTQVFEGVVIAVGLGGRHAGVTGGAEDESGRFDGGRVGEGGLFNVEFATVGGPRGGLLLKIVAHLDVSIGEAIFVGAISYGSSWD